MVLSAFAEKSFPWQLAREDGAAAGNYQIPSACCIPKLTAAIASQQHSPIKIGLPPVRTSFTKSVFSQMAPIAMMMKNLDSSLNGWNAEAVTPAEVAAVVITEANTKKMIKKGNTFFREKPFS